MAILCATEIELLSQYPEDVDFSDLPIETLWALYPASIISPEARKYLDDEIPYEVSEEAYNFTALIHALIATAEKNAAVTSFLWDAGFAHDQNTVTKNHPLMLTTNPTEAPVVKEFIFTESEHKTSKDWMDMHTSQLTHAVVKGAAKVRGEEFPTKTLLGQFETQMLRGLYMKLLVYSFTDEPIPWSRPGRIDGQQEAFDNLVSQLRERLLP